MRKYSKVFSVIWQDKTIRELEDQFRTIFFYLLTSPHTNMVGWFYLNINYAAADLRYPIDRVSEGLNRLEDRGLITYSEESDMVVIHNFLKFNPVKGSKQAKGAINTIENLPDKDLLNTFVSCVAKHKVENEALYKMILNVYDDQIKEEEIYPIEGVSKGYGKGINTNTDTNTNTESERKIDDFDFESFFEENQKQLEPFLEKMSKGVVLNACKISMKANKPMAYCRTVLNDWQEKGIESVKDLEKASKNNDDLDCDYKWKDFFIDFDKYKK
jgi:DnaD/phage-associated family protein